MTTRSMRTSWSITSATVLGMAIGACSKGSSGSAPSASSSLPAVASAEPPRPAPSASAAAERTSWSGSYTAKVGAVDPPKNANEKVWAQDPGSAAVGKGTVDLSVRERGEAGGETKGPLGEMTISGLYDGKELRANLQPKDPKADGAMTGFMVLSTDGDALKGTLRVSGRDARIVREAAVELAKK
jgi:hypothetical protein